VLRGRPYQLGSITEARRSTPEAANTSAQAGSQPGWWAKSSSKISACLNMLSGMAVPMACRRAIMRKPF